MSKLFDIAKKYLSFKSTKNYAETEDIVHGKVWDPTCSGDEFRNIKVKMPYNVYKNILRENTNLETEITDEKWETIYEVNGNQKTYSGELMTGISIVGYYNRKEYYGWFVPEFCERYYSVKSF